MLEVPHRARNGEKIHQKRGDLFNLTMSDFFSRWRLCEIYLSYGCINYYVGMGPNWFSGFYFLFGNKCSINKSNRFYILIHLLFCIHDKENHINETYIRVKWRRRSFRFLRIITSMGEGLFSGRVICHLPIIRTKHRVLSDK